MSKLHTIAKELLSELKVFDASFHEAIIYIYVHKAYVLGDQEKWAKDQEAQHQHLYSDFDRDDTDLDTDEYYDKFEDAEDIFDENFFGGDHENK